MWETLGHPCTATSIIPDATIKENVPSPLAGLGTPSNVLLIPISCLGINCSTAVPLLFLILYYYVSWDHDHSRYSKVNLWVILSSSELGGLCIPRSSFKTHLSHTYLIFLRESVILRQISHLKLDLNSSFFSYFNIQELILSKHLSLELCWFEFLALLSMMNTITFLFSWAYCGSARGLARSWILRISVNSYTNIQVLSNEYH